MTSSGPVRSNHNWNMLFSQGVLNVLGGLLGIFVWAPVRTPALDLARTFMVASGGLTLIFTSRRKEPIHDLAASSVFGLNLLSNCWTLWWSQATLAAQGGDWVPFQTHDLTAMVLATLAPPIPWLGALMILLPLALALVQFVRFAPALVAHTPLGSVYELLAFALLAMAVYVLRLRGLRAMTVAAEKNAEVKMIRTMLGTLLAVKDLANTPLQALALDSDLLRRKHPEDSAIAGRMGRSTGKLQKMNGLLDERIREGGQRWAEASLDAGTRK